MNRMLSCDQHVANSESAHIAESIFTKESLATRSTAETSRA